MWIRIAWIVFKMFMPFFFDGGLSILDTWRKNRSEIRDERKRNRKDKESRKLGREIRKRERDRWSGKG